MQVENKMGTMAIPKLIMTISLPMILSLFVNNLYNFVDSIFVSRLGEDALAGISLAMPLQMIMVAMGSGLAVGLNAVISKALGEKNAEEVEKTASAAIIMIIGAYLINAIVCLLFAKFYFVWQTKGNDVIANYGLSYIRICMLLSFGQMTQWVFDRFLIATGKTPLFLATLGTASIVNLILDPIFIFGLFGFPEMGTAGAALATVIGQMSGGLLGIFLNIKYNKEIPIKFTFNISMKCVRNILRVGIPTSIIQGIMSFMGIFINAILYSFSSTAVAIYGILLKVQSMSQLVVHGVNNALIPIIAYNYGAKKGDRINQAVKFAFCFAIICMSVVFIVLETNPDKILRLFSASEQMYQIGIPAIRVMSFSIIFGAFNIIFSAIYQGFGFGTFSLYLTFVRQIIFLIPLLLICLWIGNINIIWVSFVFAELFAMPFGIILYRKLKNKIVNELISEI